jgi:NUMOD4 motif|nr:MAG TPA: NUMOD4 motif protein [Caudoviricetes sp.]
MNEIWVPVKGWEGLYEISNLKRVRVVPRRVRMLGGKYVKLKPRILKITEYNSVQLQAGGRKKGNKSK